jgi:hypothetical protein
MQVEWHISMHDNLLPAAWMGMVALYPEDFHGGRTWGDDVLQAIADWLENAQMLSTSGLSRQSLSIVLEGYTDEGAFGWRMIKRAAGLQEAMLEILRRHKLPLKQVATDFRSGVGHSCRYGHPCDLPLCFGSMVREIITGNSIIRFDGYTGGLWNLEKLVATRLHWKLSQWREEWYNEVRNQRLRSDIWGGMKGRYGIPGYAEDDNISASKEYLRMLCGGISEDEEDEDGEE